MESLYQYIGISRQGFHKLLNKTSEVQNIEDQLVERAKSHRLDHPRMGARPLYTLMQESQDPTDQVLVRQMGRDKLEEVLLRNGLRVKPIRIFHKTTYSGSFRFPNLVQGTQILDINRIWLSDLTYYRLIDGWAYLTFILDLYSRRCLGYAISQSMITEQTTIPALQMALATRGVCSYENQLCLHSDGGGQYYDKGFLNLINQYQIQSSMAEGVYENPHMERFHSTVKNDYLIPWGVNSIGKLHKSLRRFLYLYNNVRPHQSLKGKSPANFEQLVQQIPLCQRPSVLFKKIT